MKYLTKQSALAFLQGMALLAVLGLPLALQAQEPQSSLDTGYRDMYNLQFDQAHRVFAQWPQAHPDLSLIHI